MCLCFSSGLQRGLAYRPFKKAERKSLVELRFDAKGTAHTGNLAEPSQSMSVYLRVPGRDAPLHYPAGHPIRMTVKVKPS